MEFKKYSKDDPRRDKRNSGNRCVLIGCQKNKRDYPHLSFFKFPADYRRDDWLSACNVPDESPTMLVCSEHFESKFLGKKFLKKNAIPTIKLSIPNQKTTNNIEDNFSDFDDNFSDFDDDEYDEEIVQIGSVTPSQSDIISSWESTNFDPGKFSILYVRNNLFLYNLLVFI